MTLESAPPVTIDEHGQFILMNQYAQAHEQAASQVFLRVARWISKGREPWLQRSSNLMAEKRFCPGAACWPRRARSTATS
ncbi:hypothetical protein [Deinococcus sonorensis]|uniref:Uncharacterized protein n=2 Tax=Deinococcus sonorensis TaxID=309891 RepID=A0AAU7UEW2_9DEIO